MSRSDGQFSEEDIAALPMWTLVQAYHGVSRRFYEIFASEHLSPVQFGVLQLLDVTPGITQADLARRTLVRQQSMGELVTTLGERGLLTRDLDNRRGRAVPMVLTDEGRLVLRRAARAVAEFNDPETTGLTQAESSTLNELLHKVIRTSQDW